MELMPAVFDELKKNSADIPVVIGGIIPDKDAAVLKQLGVKAVFQPWSLLEEVTDKIFKIVSQT